MFSKLNTKRLVYSGILFFSLIISYTQCAKKFDQQDSFSPSNDIATVGGITANGTSVLYCSISGGCPITVTGKNFFPKARVFIGPYECKNVVISTDAKTISCTAGKAQTGVYDISVLNPDGRTSVLDPATTAAALQFSYASFLYLGSQETPGKVYAYAQNPATGALLTISGSPFSIAGNNGTYGAVISPNNQFIYVANFSSNTVSIYSINPTNGKLTAVGTPLASGGSGPNGLFFHPSGNFIYVTNQTSNNISGFNVAGDGTLTAITGSPYADGTATTLNGVVIEPTGRFLYVASMGGTGGVAGFTIDVVTGALVVIPGSPFKNTNGGFSNTGDGIAAHQNGKWLYVGLTGQKRVAAYSIDQVSGVLTGIGTPLLNNSSTPYVDNGGSGANISPDGFQLYGTAFSTVSTDPKKVIVYNIDQSTGALTKASETDSGGGPNDIRVDTNGKFVYTCNTINVPSISGYSRNSADGSLTPLAPRDVSIPAPASGPGIMVIQKN